MAKKAYIGVDGVARKIKKVYVGVPTEALPDGEPFVTNLYNKNGVIDVDYQGNVRSDLVYKNDDGTVTIKSNYNTLVYGQNLYGAVKEGHAYTFSCDVVSATIAQVHIAMDCMKDGARYIEYVGLTAVSAGAKIARTFTVPSGCTAVVFGIANPTTDTSQYVVVNNIKVVEGAYTADNIPAAVFSVARKIKKSYIGVGGVARSFYDSINLITFYYMYGSKKYTFRAEEGMTWNEFVNSSYNPTSEGVYFRVDMNWITDQSWDIIQEKSGSMVTKNVVIKANCIYEGSGISTE